MSSFPRATENPPYLLGVNGGIFFNSTLSSSCLSHHPFHPFSKLLGFRDKPLAFRGGDRGLYVVGTILLTVKRMCLDLLSAGGCAQEQPGATRSSQQQPGATKSSQEQPGAPRSSQEQPGAASSSQTLLNLIWNRCVRPKVRGYLIGISRTPEWDLGTVCVRHRKNSDAHGVCALGARYTLGLRNRGVDFEV